MSVHVLRDQLGRILKSSFFRRGGRDLGAIEAIGWKRDHDVPPSRAKVRDDLFFGNREQHDGAVVEQKPFRLLCTSRVEVEKSGPVIVSGKDPFAVVGDELVGVWRQGARPGKDRGGEEALAELKDARPRVLLTFADNGEVLGAIGPW